MAKLQHVEEVEETDAKTGEVRKITKTKSFSIKTNTEEFFMTFIDHMSGLFKITRPMDMNVLAKLCTLAEFNTGIVRLTKVRREEVRTALGKENAPISPQHLSNSLGRLRKLGLIDGKGDELEIDPRVFWKGTSDQRRKLLKERKMEIHLKFFPKD